MADPFRKDANRVAGGECTLNRGEGLDVLRRIDSLVQAAVHRDGVGTLQDRRERPIEQRRLGEEADVPRRRGPDHRGIEQGVGMIRQQQDRAAARNRTGSVDPVEDRRDRPRRGADDGKGSSSGHRSSDSSRLRKKASLEFSLFPSAFSLDTRGSSSAPLLEGGAQLCFGGACRLPPAVDVRRRSESPPRSRRTPPPRGWRFAPIRCAADDQAEDRRTEHAGVSLEHAEEREELRRLVPRDHAREQRPAERLRAALHHADQHGQREEMRGRRHEVSKHG